MYIIEYYEWSKRFKQSIKTIKVCNGIVELGGWLNGLKLKPSGSITNVYVMIGGKHCYSINEALKWI